MSTFNADGRTAYLMLADFNAGMSIAAIAAAYSVTEALVTAQLQALAGSGVFTPAS